MPKPYAKCEGCAFGLFHAPNKAPAHEAGRALILIMCAVQGTGPRRLCRLLTALEMLGLGPALWISHVPQRGTPRELPCILRAGRLFRPQSPTFAHRLAQRSEFF